MTGITRVLIALFGGKKNSNGQAIRRSGRNAQPQARPSGKKAKK